MITVDLDTLTKIAELSTQRSAIVDELQLLEKAEGDAVKVRVFVYNGHGSNTYSKEVLSTTSLARNLYDAIEGDLNDQLYHVDEQLKSLGVEVQEV